ncbi:MAG: hypothetical protein GY759_03730 [Chloroflexi bacterium]|nr:hypothetical protein [Chloroflexota bacterium]
MKRLLSRLLSIATLLAALLLVMLWLRDRLARRSRAENPAIYERVEGVRQHVVDEMVKAFGFPLHGWQHAVLSPFLWLPSRYFSTLAVGFDRAVEQQGFDIACRQLLRRFVENVRVRGDTQIPENGPLLIISNHPGAYDAPLIAASLPRSDLKIITSTVPFVQDLPFAGRHAIEITRDPYDAMRGLRVSIKHLQQGGALLILATGVVDPDPDVLPGAHEALDDWSASMAILLKKVPETKVVVTIVSGVLSPRWLSSPLTRIQKEVWRQRKLAEIFQVVQQLLLPGSLMLQPRLSFAPPRSASDLADDPNAVHQAIIDQAHGLLTEHMDNARCYAQLRFLNLY